MARRASQEGVAELGGERVRAAVALLELAGQAHPEVVHVVRRQPRRVTRRPLVAAWLGLACPVGLCLGGGVAPVVVGYCV